MLGSGEAVACRLSVVAGRPMGRPAGARVCPLLGWGMRMRRARIRQGGAGVTTTIRGWTVRGGCGNKRGGGGEGYRGAAIRRNGIGLPRRTTNDCDQQQLRSRDWNPSGSAQPRAELLARRHPRDYHDQSAGRSELIAMRVAASPLRSAPSVVSCADHRAAAEQRCGPTAPAAAAGARRPAAARGLRRPPPRARSPQQLLPGSAAQ